MEKARYEEEHLHMFHFRGNNNANVLPSYSTAAYMCYYSSRIEVLTCVSIIDTYLLMLNVSAPIPSSSRSPSASYSFQLFENFRKCLHVADSNDDRMASKYSLVSIQLNFKDFKVFLLQFIQVRRIV